MNQFLNYHRSLIAILSIIFCVLLLTKCIDKGKPENSLVKNKKGQQFAGSSTCITCHKKIYNSHKQTAHFLTSKPAIAQYLKGSFDSGKNTFDYGNGKVVVMENRGSNFYQVEYDSGVQKISRRFDIVIGSGSKGQSFISVIHNKLYQLPITYFTAANQWANSPGYPKKIIFNRPITSRCLECHSTFAKVISTANEETEEFDKNQMIYGVDCEKCHGPAAEHVAYQTQNPTAVSAKFIINPASLSWQQNLDLCASCHGGRLKKTRPSFEFTVGDKLADYFELDTILPDADKIDVHGNQYGLLRASKCFRLSEIMTCSTCHNLHENERGNIALFSQRCMSCHNKEHGNFCKLNPSIGDGIKQNCIDCHMPLQSSRAIAVFLPGNTVPTAALIRSHLISIYPAETKKKLHYKL